MNKHGIRLITAVVTSSMIVTPVLAAPSVDDLKKEKAAKQSEVSSLQSQLTTLMGKVNTLESELIQTGEDITKAQGDLEVAQEKEKEQYAAMKKRIKYMYEAGNDSAFYFMQGNFSPILLLYFFTTGHTYSYIPSN